ncbi:MAG: DUF72 domain-containing protein [Woeseiaceae bacterium]
MKLYCGTSGFSFKEWKGPFYPEKLPAAKMLAFYAERLPTVEINNTFYRMPRPNVLEGWAAQVPDTFRFAIKAPRRITHAKQLADCSEEAGYFFETLAALGERLGVVLFQLPPHARVGVEKLGTFLGLVPDNVPVAFEFRHPSWRDEAVYAALAQRGAAWVTADNDGGEPPELPKTGALTYLRLRAESYSDEALKSWKARCADFERAFVFFKHEDGGAGPAYAARMLALRPLC